MKANADVRAIHIAFRSVKIRLSENHLATHSALQVMMDTKRDME